MELTEPKPKKNCKLQPNLPLPINENDPTDKITGIFNEFCVIVEDQSEMERIISMGYFGKANLSRSFPQFHYKNKTEIIRNRVFENRKKIEDKNKHRPKKVIVIADSDDENPDYFINLKPQFQFDQSGIKEKVQLGLEEAFFLQSAVDCLEIFDNNNKKLSNNEAWELFQATDKNFLSNYIVYYYYRAKNWVVKPGIKFGGDYLLYKQGPPFYHASYVVIINVVDENLKEIEKFERRSMDLIQLMALNRLCETSGKELLICQVVWPESLLESVKEHDLPKFSIKETLMKRWHPTKEKAESDDD